MTSASSQPHTKKRGINSRVINERRNKGHRNGSRNIPTTALGMISGVAVEMAPGTAPGTAPRTAPGTAPGMAPTSSKRDNSHSIISQRRNKGHRNDSSNIPRKALGMISGVAVEMAPRTAPETAPGTAPGMAPTSSKRENSQSIISQRRSKRHCDDSSTITGTASGKALTVAPTMAPTIAPEPNPGFDSSEPVTRRKLHEELSKIRYAVCPCHPQDLANIENINVEVNYGSCAENCVFCNHKASRASNLRKHVPRCQNSRGIRHCARKERTSIQGHTWSRLSGSQVSLPPAVQSLTSSPEKSIIKDGPPPVQVIWTPLNPQGSKIDWMRTLVVPFRYTVQELPKKLPWIDSGDLVNIKKELGKQFVVKTGEHEQPDVHQGVVTTQILKHISNTKVYVRAWCKFWKAVVEQDEVKVMNSMFRDTNGQARSTVILLHWTEEASWVEEEMCQFYMRLERLRAYHGASIRRIPSHTEALQARGKIQDVRALDEEAFKTKQYRPRTCFPGGVCCLETEAKTVHKRQDSCGRAHVLVRTKDQRGALTCSINPTIPMKSIGTEALWFHQEFVDTIERFGEFRAFIVTEPDPKALRGRKGKIVCIAHTTWQNNDGSELHIELVDDRTFGNINCEHLTRKGLEGFLLSQFECLRRRHDWKERWGTLETGVRMDAAVSPNSAISPVIGEEGFWLVEVTRLYFADFFSDYIHGEPKYRLCEEIAHSIASYLSIEKERGR